MLGGLVILAVICFACTEGPLLAQRSVAISPVEIYPGDNTVTVRVMAGIREVRCVAVSTSPNVRVEGSGGVDSCPVEHDLRVFVGDPGADVTLFITVIDCNSRRHVDSSVSLNTKWNVNKIRYGTVERGVEICREFWINSEERDTWLDSVTVGDPDVWIVLPTTLPVRIRKGATYRYQVCFRGGDKGDFEFPVTTWMRRDHPWGGYTTYAVADTGSISVVETPIAPQRPAPAPRDTSHSTSAPILDRSFVDPTTFRSVVTPNAVIPPKGTLYGGSYDILGLTAGYAVVDNMMVIVGGAPPLPDDWGGLHGEAFSAWSVGIKAGTSVGRDWRVAVGYQFAQSTYDNEATSHLESRIALNIPYAAVSYGNDDRRASLTAGYALKRHQTIEGGTFDRNAWLAIVGGDWRIGRRWKIAGELGAMQTLGIVPLTVTARHFSDTWALDMGLCLLAIETDEGRAPAVPIAPVISFVATLQP